MLPWKMALAFPRLSWWLWSGKDREATVSSSSALNSSSELGLDVRESDSVKYASVTRSKMDPTQRKIKRKWHSREERRIDKQYDVVLVPSDCGCLSGSESDDSDWSIGWLEPHAPEFISDDEAENSFAVLVPCYGRGRRELVELNNPNNQFLGAIGNLPNTASHFLESKKVIEEWLSSLQNN